jgi:hypothetical protein
MGFAVLGRAEDELLQSPIAGAGGSVERIIGGRRAEESNRIRWWLAVLAVLVVKWR